MKLNNDEIFNTDINRAGAHKPYKSINGPNTAFSSNLVSGIKSVGAWVMGYFKINDAFSFHSGFISSIDDSNKDIPIYKVKLALSGEEKETAVVI